MRIPIPFSGGQTTSQSVVIDGQQAVNWYPSAEGPGSKSQITMRPTPGLKYLFDGGPGPIRSNGIVFKGKQYFVSNNKLIEIDSNFSGAVEIGTLNANNTRCTMAASPTELLIVDGTDGYIWDGTTFTEIIDPDFPAATHVTWLDFYFIVNDAGTGQFYVSALNDGTSWSGLDFATAESSPDNLLAVYATLNELWLIGEYTTEAYYNSGNIDFPFDQIPNGVLSVGIHAPYSITKNESGSLTWLGRYEDGGIDVVRARVGSFHVISDANIGFTLTDKDNSIGAIAWNYNQAAHSFYVLTLPGADLTLVFDQRENYWHARKSYGLGRHRIQGHGYFSGKHIVGDYSGAQIYEYDLDTYTDNGQPIERIRRGIIIHKNRYNLFVSRLEIEFEAGIGTVTGQGTDPQAMLRYTRNGKVWSSELWRGIGKIGEYDAACVWDQLGMGKQFQFEIKITDPVKPILVNAYLDVEAGYG